MLHLLRSKASRKHKPVHREAEVRDLETMIRFAEVRAGRPFKHLRQLIEREKERLQFQRIQNTERVAG